MDMFLIRTCTCYYFHAAVYPFFKLSKFCAIAKVIKVFQAFLFSQQDKEHHNIFQFSLVHVHTNSNKEMLCGETAFAHCSQPCVELSQCSACHTMLQWHILVSECAGDGEGAGLDWGQSLPCWGHCSASSPSSARGCYAHLSSWAALPRGLCCFMCCVS